MRYVAAMLMISNFLIILIALLHTYFLILEMFFWKKPYGLKVFKQTRETAMASAALAANQGLYNGFLAAGLVWGLAHPDPVFSFQLKLFFISCVILAGFYGGYSVSSRIFFIQALPAILALVLILKM